MSARSLLKLTLQWINAPLNKNSRLIAIVLYVSHLILKIREVIMNKQKSGNYFKVLSIMALGSFLAISIPANAAKNNKEKADQPFQNKIGNTI
ncbi:hypothetical protein F6Y02_38500 (plasmid) [Bacillus megaterium]|nr:hypothetical protein [Priestia megaterium]